jgi:hypothetical protein
MSREHTELAIGAVRDHVLDFSLEEAPFYTHDAEGVFHWRFFMSSPCARASSMVPTM